MAKLTGLPGVAGGWLWALLAAGPAAAQDYFLAPETPFVRAVVSVEATALEDAVWQAFAARAGVVLAVVGDNPQGQLAGLAAATGRPEVAVAPYVPYGLSSNGRRAVSTATAFPDRCAAILAHHPGRMFLTGNDGFNFNRLDGTVAGDTLFDFSPAFAVPALFFAGERDNLSGFVLPTENALLGRRRADAPWALVTSPNTTHTGAPLPAALTTVILEGMLARRLPAENWPADAPPTLRALDPTTGWLGNILTGAVHPYADYPGDRGTAAWLPDAPSAAAWAAFVVPQPFALPPQAVVLPSLIGALEVLDPANNRIHPADQAGGASAEAAWKVCANLQPGDLCFAQTGHGSAIFGLPGAVERAEWIRPMTGAAAFTGAVLLRFTVAAEADVYIAHSDAVPNKPAWLSAWTDTGENLTLGTGNNLFSEPFSFSLYRRRFAAGATVETGSNGSTQPARMYLVLAQPVGGDGAPTVSLAVADAQAGEAGLNPGAFTVTRGTATAGDLTIGLEAGGTATAGADYVALPATVLLPDGQSSVTVTVTPLDDTLTEGTETVALTLLPGAGYALGANAAGTVFLADDDGAALPSVSLAVSPSTLAEGAPGPATFTLTRAGPTDAPLGVTLSLTGAAGAGADYAEFDLNQVIPAGAATVSWEVAVLGDAVPEPDETVVVGVLSTAAYQAAAGADTATLTIQDNDASPSGATVTLATTHTQLSESGAVVATLTVSRTGGTVGDLTVNLSVGGTATPGADYAALPAALTIPDGSAAATLELRPLDDATPPEGTESVVVNLTAGFGYVLGNPSSVTVNLTENDNALRSVVANLTYASPPTGDLQLDLYLPQAGPGPFPVVLAIHGGGWQNGTRGTLGAGNDLNTAGFAVAAVSYRLSGTAKWPAQLQDIKAAVRWLRGQAGTYNLDPARVAAWGQSAGAHLALMAGVTGGRANAVVGGVRVDLEGPYGAHWDQPDTLQAAAAWYAATDLLRMDNAPGQASHNGPASPESNLLGATLQTVPELASTANPLVYLGRDHPPLFVTHGDEDGTVPFLQAEQLFDRARRLGAKAEFLPVLGEGHGFPGTQNLPLVRWLRGVLGVGPLAAGPTAVLAADSLTGTAPLTVRFDAAASLAGGAALAGYVWSFGDNSAAAGAVVDHTFAQPGTYRVTLAVTDTAGALSNATAVVEVLPPTVAGELPAVTLTAPAPGTALLDPGTVYLAATASAAPGSTVAAVEFWVNGEWVGTDTTSPYGLAVGGLGGGALQFQARVRDNLGRAGESALVPAEVLNPAPAVALGTGTGGPALALTFYRWPGLTNRARRLWGTGNLNEWSPVVPVETVESVGGLERVRWEDPLPLQAPAVRLLRVETFRPAP